MAKIGLIDFSSDVLGQQAKAHTVKDYKTRWNGGTDDLDLSGLDVIFINGNYSNQTAWSLHATVHESVQQVIGRGGAVFMFLGQNCMPYHVCNVVGMPPEIQIAATPDNLTACTLMTSSPLDPIFSRFGDRI